METKNPVNGEISLTVNSEFDIVTAREKAKWLAKEIGFQGSQLTVLSTLISELVRKAVAFNSMGNVTIQTLERGLRKGIAISISEVPVESSRQHRFSTALQRNDQIFYNQRLAALVRRHVADEFEVHPNAQNGTIIKVVKWL